MAKATKPFRASIATANALRSGTVVFRASDGSWSPDLAAAEIAETHDAAATLLAKALHDQDDCKIVEPALIEIQRQGAVVRPISLREAIRAAGPTVVISSDPATRSRA